MEEKDLNSGVSRRDLMRGVGVFAAGVAVAQFGNVIPKAYAAVDPKKWPWPYEKLDPEKTAALAHDEWYRVFCGAAVISSIFSQLAEKVGEPYKSFPVDGFYFLAGGIADWGTVCGSVSGANTAANLIIGPKVHGHQASFTMGSNIAHWYSNTEQPVYVPKNPRANKDKITRTKSNSPLCHISVGRWMKGSGYAFASPERKDRCARLTASVAYKLVEDLNVWKDGKYSAENKWFAPGAVNMTSQQNCSDCHGTNVPTAKVPAK